jgi:membrane protein DedA with SNARE-associated domain
LVLFEILTPIVDFITSQISNLGYAGIFILMILESALIPIPSEIIMPFSGFLVSEDKLDFTTIVLTGSIGNLAGSIITYYLGHRIRRATLLKYGRFLLVRESHLEFAERIFQTQGSKITFVGRLLPAVRTYISFAAGINKIPFQKFVLYTFAGSIIWNTLLTYAGLQLGENWKNIEAYSPILDGIAAAVVIGFTIWFIRSSRKFRKHNNKTTTLDSDA